MLGGAGEVQRFCYQIIKCSLEPIAQFYATSGLALLNPNLVHFSNAHRRAPDAETQVSAVSSSAEPLSQRLRWVAWNVDEGGTAAFFIEATRNRFDEDFDGLVTGMNFDANGRISQSPPRGAGHSFLG
jgi:hypothetical protein